jgi:hypothetical protein
VQYIGTTETWEDGDRLSHGVWGIVLGPSDDDDDNSLEVRFPGCSASIDCLLSDLARGNFTEYLDRATGRTFYVSEDGAARWDRPQGAHLVRDQSVVEAIQQGRGVVRI